MSYDCYCDYETPEFFSKKTVTARVLHCCGECHSGIQPGEKYELVAGKWSGDFSTHKTCARCIDIRDHLQAHIKCFCWYYGGLDEAVRNEMENLPREADGSGLYFEIGRRAVAIKRAPSYRDLVANHTASTDQSIEDIKNGL